MSRSFFAPNLAEYPAIYVRFLSRIPTALVIAAGLSVIGALAISSAFVPNLASFGLAAIGLGLPLLLLIWFRPEFGLLAIIFLSSSFVRPDIVDVRLPIGGGLELRDLVLLGIFGLMGFRGLIRKTIHIPWWPVGMPLLIFLALAFFSLVYAIVFQGVETNWAFAEFRDLLSYLGFFIAGWVLVQRKQIVLVITGLFVIADLTASIVILQQFFGVNLPLLTTMTGPYWGVWNQIDTATGIGAVRIVPPGHVLMYFMMVLAGCLLIFIQHKRRRIVFALQFVYLNLGLLLTYTRAQWTAAACAIALIAIALFPVYKTKITRYLLVGIPLFLLIFGLFSDVLQKDLEKMPFLTALVQRAMGIFTLSETLDTSSLEWRLFEIEKALEVIVKHPLLGVGLGNSYRTVTTLQGEARGSYGGSLLAGQVSRFTRYVHSSYIMIMVKMGISGLIGLLWFAAAFIISGWKLYQNLTDSLLKGIVLSIVAGFAGLLLWSIFHQHLVLTKSTTTVALMTGIVASVHYLYKLEREVCNHVPLWSGNGKGPQ